MAIGQGTNEHHYPFPKPEGAVFGPDDIHAMSAALEDVCKRLNVDASSRFASLNVHAAASEAQPSCATMCGWNWAAALAANNVQRAAGALRR